MVMTQVLQTQRLTLRLLAPDDLDAVHELFSSSGHTVGDGPVRERAESAQWLVRREMRYREQGLAWYGLWTRLKVFVGTCGVFLGERCGTDPEIGYEVHVSQRGKGLAHEAAQAVTDEAHSAGHARLWATIRPANVASTRVVERLGYQLVKSQPDAEGDLNYYLSTADTADHGRHIGLKAS
ncbi:Predicted acetyltransferase [Mycobacteroides abscessus subsp. abscessus]|nr:Predicted acetyltransferase [Mycobacteroides abscessus subsp. abscessus]